MGKKSRRGELLLYTCVIFERTVLDGADSVRIHPHLDTYSLERAESEGEFACVEHLHALLRVLMLALLK